MSPRVHYEQRPSSSFLECQRRVHEYLQKEGNPLGRADQRMGLKVAVQLAILFGSYGLMISNFFQGWAFTVVQIIFQFSMFVVSVGVIHDATHGALFKSTRANRMMSYGFDFFGINSHYWIKNHIESHHKAPNVPGHDSALEGFNLVRLHSQAPWRWWHSYQHFYMFGVYAFVTLFQVFLLEWISFAQNVIGFKHGERNIVRAISIALSKLWVLTYSILLPVMLLDISVERILFGFFAGHILAGLALGLIFQTTHLALGNRFVPLTSDDKIQSSFDHHVLNTTINFGVQNPIFTWIAGGLNLHVTHHLFPHVSQIYLPEITKIVREIALREGLPYRELSVFEALQSHIQMLRVLGEKPISLENLTPILESR